MAAPKLPEETAKRRAAVKDFMETIGPYSVPIKTLAEQHNVTVKVIYNDVNFWIKKIDLSKMDLEGRKIILSVRKNMAIVEELKAKGTHAERIKAIQTSNQTAETLTKMMENYGFKEKIAEKHEVAGSLGVVFNEVTKSAEEIKDGRKRDNSKREAERTP